MRVLRLTARRTGAGLAELAELAGLACMAYSGMGSAKYTVLCAAQRPGSDKLHKLRHERRIISAQAIYL
jgi:hypothetical protein